MIVVDTNIISYFFLHSQHSAQVIRLYQADADWVAPLLWRSEFRNVLLHYLRKELLSLKDGYKIFETAQRMMRGQEYEANASHVLQLAASSRCSAYDCEFIALAQYLQIPLVTFDREILKDFPQTATSVQDYLKQVDK